MSGHPNTSAEVPALGETVSRLDEVLLLAALAITVAAGAATPENSTSRYVLLGIAAAAYIKAAAGFLKAERAEPEPDTDVLLQYNAFGEM